MAIEHRQATGSAAITGATGSETLLAAMASGQYFVQKICITIGAYSDTGTISITDGTTAIVGPILAKDGNGGCYNIDFGDVGYPWGATKAVVLTVATANVTCRATVVGYKSQGAT